jgi:hypothetical protein
MDGERAFSVGEPMGEALPDIEEGGVPCVLGFVEWRPSPLSYSGYWSEQVDIDGFLRATVDRVIPRRSIRQILLG